MSTPIDDYLFTNNIPRELYLNNRRIMEGMAKGEVDVSMVWATAIAVAKQEFPDAKFHMVEGYVPVEGQRFNMKFAVRKEDQSLLDFVNEGIDELLTNGKMQADRGELRTCRSMHRSLRKLDSGRKKENVAVMCR